MDANQDVLTFLKARAQPGTGDGWDLDGWELHIHPDLVERFEEIARSPRAVIPVYGVMALERKGVLVVVALGMSHLLFRLAAAPEGIQAADPLEPLCGNGWYAVDAWRSPLERLIALVKEARQQVG